MMLKFKFITVFHNRHVACLIIYANSCLILAIILADTNGDGFFFVF